MDKSSGRGNVGYGKRHLVRGEAVEQRKEG
jgi:hypothetical protein